MRSSRLHWIAVNTALATLVMVASSGCLGSRLGGGLSKVPGMRWMARGKSSSKADLAKKDPINTPAKAAMAQGNIGSPAATGGYASSTSPPFDNQPRGMDAGGYASTNGAGTGGYANTGGYETGGYDRTAGPAPQNGFYPANYQDERAAAGGNNFADTRAPAPSYGGNAGGYADTGAGNPRGYQDDYRDASAGQRQYQQTADARAYQDDSRGGYQDQYGGQQDPRYSGDSRQVAPDAGNYDYRNPAPGNYEDSGYSDEADYQDGADYQSGDDAGYGNSRFSQEYQEDYSGDQYNSRPAPVLNGSSSSARPWNPGSTSQYEGGGQSSPAGSQYRNY